MTLANCFNACTLLLVVFLVQPVNAQSVSQEHWTPKELEQYAALKRLAEFTYQHEYNEPFWETLTTEHLYLDYLLTDTTSVRDKERYNQMLGFFVYFKQTVDSLGVANLDAAPVRFYRDHKFYDVFDENKAIKTVGGSSMALPTDNVFVWYRKEDPYKVKGALWFDEESNRLISWILLKQGGAGYFITGKLL